MTTPQIIFVVALFLLMDLVVIGAVLHLALQSLRTLAARFPAQPPAPTARTKLYQSIKLDAIGLGGCLDIAADTTHLHIRPMLLARLFRVPPFSIPWSAIEVTSRGRWRADLKIGQGLSSSRLIVPLWVLEPPSSDAAS